MSRDSRPCAISCFLLLASSVAMAESTVPDGERSKLIDIIGYDCSPTAQIKSSVSGYNPSGMYYARDYSISSFQLRGEYLHRDEAMTVQTGRGHLLGNVEATSYMRLGQNIVVWGKATFTTGSRRDIRWNNSGDYELVGPYVLGDSVGGDLATRSYSFMGGYAGEHKGWTWGAQAAYRATIDYRNRDPRDKIVISDLGIKAGASRRVSSGYTIGLGGALRVYNQESDITFYNPNNEIRTYALTGLGTFYSRFSGNSGYSTAYTGLGYSSNLSLLSTSSTGLFLTGDFTYLPIRQILRDYNNLELTRAQNHYMTLHGGYVMQAGKVALAPSLHALFHRQVGFENLYGTSVGNNYVRIGTRRTYYRDRIGVRLELPVTVSLNHTMLLDVRPAVAAGYDHEDYRQPSRVLESSALTPALAVRYSWRASHSLNLSLEAIGNHTSASAHRMRLTALDTSSEIGRMVVHNFTMHTADATTYGGSIGAEWAFRQSMCLCINAMSHVTSWQHHGKAMSAELSVGIKF